jgi:hypothetical protein
MKKKKRTPFFLVCFKKGAKITATASIDQEEQQSKHLTKPELKDGTAAAVVVVLVVVAAATVR